MPISSGLIARANRKVDAVSVMDAQFWAPYLFPGPGRGPIPISCTVTKRRVSYDIPPCHGRHMAKRARKWRDKALAIEFWVATCIVAGAFVVGLLRALGYLFD